MPRSAPFTCFYCGLPKEASDSSDEHIVPSCIGGSRNATLTDEVCADCNDYMSGHVDLPFARDWFIEGARLLAGIKHRGKPPVMYMGVLAWDREEVVHVTVTEKGGTLFEVEHADFTPPRIVLAIDDQDPAHIEHIRKVLKTRFDGQRVINADGGPQSEREASVLQALIAVPHPFKVKNSIRLTAWHREVVKMALGLACQQLDGFTTSASADMLRGFIFEDDVDKRDAMKIGGRVGLQESAPLLTKLWHPGGDEHLFALVETDGRIVFVANLFGRYENFVEVDGTGAFAGKLPGTLQRGTAWIVDGTAKTTRGPLVLQSLYTP